MPFTVNVGPYKGGDYLFQGISNLGSGISEGVTKAIADYKKTQEEQGADEVLMDFYRKNGMVPPETEADYIKGSHSGKTGIIAGLTRQFALTQQQQQEKRLQDEAAATNLYRQAQLKQAAAQESRLTAQETREAAAAKAKEETDILATAPPTAEEEAKANKQGYTIIFNPATQKNELKVIQVPGGRGGRASDKTAMTTIGPDGQPHEIYVTGNKFLEIARDPVQFKKNYGVTQSVFADPTQTRVGTVDPNTGEFTQDANGDTIQYGVHKDPKIGTEVVGGTIPREEWERGRAQAAAASQALPKSAGVVAAPSATPAPTAGARPQVGDTKQFQGVTYKFKGGNPGVKSNWVPQ